MATKKKKRNKKGWHWSMKGPRPLKKRKKYQYFWVYRNAKGHRLEIHCTSAAYDKLPIHIRTVADLKGIKGLKRPFVKKGCFKGRFNAY